MDWQLIISFEYNAFPWSGFSFELFVLLDYTLCRKFYVTWAQVKMLGAIYV